MSPVSAAIQQRPGAPRPGAETLEVGGCQVVLRRVEGPAARELFLLCRPPATCADAALQAEAIYQAIAGVLAAEGGSIASLVTETVFFRNLDADIAAVRAARQRAWGVRSASTHRHATTEIQQPPVEEDASLLVAIHAVVPGGIRSRLEPVSTLTACGCAECGRVEGLRIRTGDETRFHASGLCGAGADAYEQTLAMFALAENLLQRAGMTFSDVVRTWIHLRDIERDYPALNRARRAFFADRGIDPAPASTGIGGIPPGETHDLCLGLYAIKGGRSVRRSVMTAPTLNEAVEYGADFVRGMAVADANKVALHVSGTASIDEHGRTAHVDDFEAQAGRMLVNIEALLARQGARFADVVSAISYVKHPSDATRLQEILRDAGFEGFPNAIVLAPVCRPELLCEIEALAVLPHAFARRSA